MPTLKGTRLQHIQDLLCKKKKALLQKDVPSRKVPQWPQLAMNRVYDQIIELHPGIIEYLPSPSCEDEKHQYPEREFFYKVLYKLHPHTVDDLIKQAAAFRQPAAQNL